MSVTLRCMHCGEGTLLTSARAHINSHALFSCRASPRRARSESHLSIHTWPERGYAAVDLFTCGEPSPLPCSAYEAVRLVDGTWTCSGGQPVADTGGALWAAAQALLSALSAKGAMVTWLDRGMAAEARGGSPRSYGWLAGLESEGQEPTSHEL